mmetsp:Transcript_37175/g.54470  ORF Transcript_37175/g.54470 Transcript_37175/m.54470 type:complete len:205 (+) Transcript_37175:37-651(+)
MSLQSPPQQNTLPCATHLFWFLLLFSSLLSFVKSGQSFSEFEDAIRRDDVEALDILLMTDPVDLNLVNARTGQSLLMFSVLSGKENSVRYLLEKGADTTIAEKDGYTPVHGAGFQGRANIMKELIKRGLDFRDQHSDQFEPFHRACWGREQRHTETIEVLLEAGVPFDAPGGPGGTLCLEMTQNKGTQKLLQKWAKKRNEADEF